LIKLLEFFLIGTLILFQDQLPPKFMFVSAYFKKRNEGTIYHIAGYAASTIWFPYYGNDYIKLG
jgi:hypothetical protein